MTPDPFRSLDHIDPPDRWEEITRRAGADAIDVDLDLDLEGVRLPRSRRRATLLVAAAAAVALVAGVTVAGVGGDDHDGVATTPSPSTGISGECPFTLGPDQRVTPGRAPLDPPVALAGIAGTEADLAPWTSGSWGTTTRSDTEVTVSVYADAGVQWPFGDLHRTEARLADDAAGKELLVVGTGTVEGAAPCRTVQVALRAGLDGADADRLRQATEDGSDPAPQIDLAAYAARHEAEVAAVVAAVRVVGVGAEVPDPCAELVDPPTTEPPTDAAEPAPPYSFGGAMADGRAYTVEVRLDGAEPMVQIDVEGGEGSGGGSLPDGPGDHGWSLTGGGRGIAYGWHPRDAVITAAVRPDGTLTSAGLAVSPGGTLYALPDVGRTPGPDGEDETWPIVHCTAAGRQSTLGLTEAALDASLAESTTISETDEELSQQIEEDAREYQAQLQCAADPSTCSTTTDPEPPAPPPFGAVTSSFGATLPDGRPYVVESDGAQLRLLVDGVDKGRTNLMTVVGEQWNVSIPPGVDDGLVIGVRPAGTSTTTILGRDGQARTTSLSVSDDGTLFAIYGPIDGADPRVTHVLEGGEVVEGP